MNPRPSIYRLSSALELLNWILSSRTSHPLLQNVSITSPVRVTSSSCCLQLFSLCCHQLVFLPTLNRRWVNVSYLLRSPSIFRRSFHRITVLLQASLCDHHGEIMLWSVHGLGRSCCEQFTLWAPYGIISSRYGPFMLWSVRTMGRSCCYDFTLWAVHVVNSSRYGSFMLWSVRTMGRSWCYDFTLWAVHVVNSSRYGSFMFWLVHSMGRSCCCDEFTLWVVHVVIRSRYGPLMLWSVHAKDRSCD